MNEMCPISNQQVNERVGQANAALTVISIILFLTTQSIWILLALMADFIIRGFINPAYSYYSAVSRSALNLLNIKPVMVNSGPKVFAAKICFLFCCLMLLSNMLVYPNITLAIGSVFAFFATLEAVFKFCVACKIYPLICRMGPDDS